MALLRPWSRSTTCYLGQMLCFTMGYMHMLHAHAHMRSLCVRRSQKKSIPPPPSKKENSSSSRGKAKPKGLQGGVNVKRPAPRGQKMASAQ